MLNDDAQLVIDSKSILAEGPCWDSQQALLYWIDGLGEKIHIYDLESDTNRTISVGQAVGCIVLRQSGGAVVALQNGFYFFDPSTDQLTHIADPESHLPNNRFNDGKCDVAGRFWAGTMCRDCDEGKVNSPPAGSVYRMDCDFGIKRIFGDVTISNGMGWSADNKTMYYIDSPTRHVVAFDFDVDSGDIRNQRVVVNTPKDAGFPDGMAVDEAGMLWVAQFGGHQVSRWNPQTGEMLQTISLPVPNITSCAFGGDNMDELYITTSRIGVPDTDDTSPAGGVFRVKLGIRGGEVFRFAG